MMFRKFRKYKFRTFTFVSVFHEPSEILKVLQFAYTSFQGFAKNEFSKVSQIGFSFRKNCKFFAMGRFKVASALQGPDRARRPA